MASSYDNFGRTLLTLGAVAVTIIIAGYALMVENYGLMASILVAAPFIVLVNNPPAWMVTIIAVSQSNLQIPGLPRGLQVVHFLMAGFCVLVVARNIITKPPRERMSAPLVFVWLFIGCILFIISQRGFGLMSSGSGSVGASSYIRIFVTAGFLFCSRYIALSRSQWCWSMLLMFAGSFIPVAGELLYFYSGGAITAQYLFIEPYVSGLVDAVDAMQTGARAVRFTSFAPIAQNLLFATLVFFTWRSAFKFSTYLLIMACIALAGFTGFRSLIADIIIITCLYRLFIARRSERLHLVFLMVVAILFALLVLIPFAQHLPLAIQRSLSFLPFVEVDSSASFDARNSTAWRLEVWRYSWMQVPDYLWVGRGITVNMDEAFSYTARFDEVLGPWFRHLYHSGPLSVLIDCGLPGFIIVALFFFFTIREVLITRSIPADDFMYRFHTFVRAKIISSIFAFIFIAGAVGMISNIFMYLAIYYGLQATRKVVESETPQRSFAMIDPSFGTSVARPTRRLQ